MRQRVIAVLGMHRSGTSCLAGTLQTAGLHLGDVPTQSTHNRLGNRENRKVRALHQALLLANQAAWDDPPEHGLHWSAEHVAERGEIIRAFREHELWGFKDPRTLLTLDGWREDLPQLELVGIFRHPAAVAASLQARHPQRFDPARGMALWRAYNQRLLTEYQRSAFPLIEFVSAPEKLQRSLASLVQRLGLATAQAHAFYDSTLQHQHPGHFSFAVDAESLSLYQQLQRRAG
jgi:hypothetical protein